MKYIETKYIDAEKLIAEIRKHLMPTVLDRDYDEWEEGEDAGLRKTLDIITSLQQEQPIEGKQVVTIFETDGDANIYWDCRSLDDVEALLASAQSFITDKQVEELRGAGSGPDYNTTEGRFRNAHKFRQEQQEVDLEKELCEYFEGWRINYYSETEELLKNNGCTVDIDDVKEIARHFWNKGYNARKEE